MDLMEGMEKLEKFCELSSSLVPKENSTHNKDNWSGLALNDEWFSQTSAYNIFDEMEETRAIVTCGAFETASTASTAPSSPADFSAQSIELTDEELTSLPVKELNKQLRNLPKDEAHKIRKRRRSLKNRGYALNCRNKRVNENEELLKENKRLLIEVTETREKLVKATEERDMFKKKYDRINSVFSTLCTTSALPMAMVSVPLAQST